MSYSFEVVDYSCFEETGLDAFPNKTIYTTKDWYSFLIRDSEITPVILRIFKDGEPIGYYYGGEVKKFCFRIIGSPFAGWSTCWMGLELIDGESKTEVLRPLWQFLTKKLHYLYGEIIDRDFNKEEITRLGFQTEDFPTLDLRIDRTDEELFKTFKTDCRNFIRQFERRGATIEIAEPDDVFAREYYDQLIDVFAKQGLTPSYSLRKVQNVMETFGKTDKLLCLRVRNPEGKSIASSIFFGFNKKCYFWGGASYREHQHYRPNEYMIWTAIRYWRARGCETLDMVGDRSYKRKFGPIPESYPLVYLARWNFLIWLRNMAKKMYWLMLKVKHPKKTEIASR